MSESDPLTDQGLPTSDGSAAPDSYCATGRERAESGGPSPNPFLFPTDTDQRFILLVTAVLGVTLTVCQMLYLTIPGNLAALNRALEACNATASQTASELNLQSFIQGTIAERDCLEPQSMGLTSAGIVGAVVLLAVTAIAYLAFPYVIIRRRHLQPLIEDDGPELVAYLDSLRREAGLARRPMFLVSLAPTRSGFAFGRLGRYFVALDSGLIPLFVTDRPAFRAVALHELAHLRNRDVDKTYLSLCVLICFLLVIYGPYSITYPITHLQDLQASPLVYALRVMVMSILTLAPVLAAFLTWIAILRVREHYADLRAAQASDVTASLQRLLEGRVAARPSLWTRLLRTHSLPADRQRLLADTEPLFRTSFWDSFAVGMVGIFTLVSLRTNLSWLFSSWLSVGEWIGGLYGIASSLVVFSLLGAGVIAASVWRAALSGIVRGVRPPSVRPVALGLWLGMIVGTTLSFYEGFLNPQNLSPFGFAGKVLFAVWLLPVLLFLFHWLGNCATVWLWVGMDRKSPRSFYRFGAITAGVSLSLIASYATEMEQTYGYFSRAIPGGVDWIVHFRVQIGVLSELAFIPAVVAFLWIYPLASTLWSRRSHAITPPDWALWNELTEERPQIRRSALSPGTSVRFGLVGGSVCFVLAAVTMSRWESLLGLSGRDLGTLAIVLPQSLLSALVAARVRYLRIEHGLLAGFCTSLGQLALITALVAFAGSPSAVVASLVEAWPDFVLGSLGSLLAAGFVAVAVDCLPALHAHKDSRSPVPPLGRADDSTRPCALRR